LIKYQMVWASFDWQEMGMALGGADAGASIVTYGNIAEPVTAHIRQMILDGAVRPGEPLRLQALAERLGVSSMPVREALRQLQAEGLVEFFPRRGAFVAQLSRDEFQELDHICEELDVLACRWLGEDFGRISLPRMAAILAEMEEAEQAGDVPRRLRLVREFRLLIWAGAHRPQLLQMLTNILDRTAQYRRVFSEANHLAGERMGFYTGMYRACEAQDADNLIATVRSLYAFARSVIMARMSAG
jgi:DNA-binding GntR family transcriptional regulator